MTDGLLAGSQWLRHERVETTQKFYGRYIQTKVSDNPLIFSLKVDVAKAAVADEPPHQMGNSATSLATPAGSHKSPSTPTKEAALVCFNTGKLLTQETDNKEDTSATI
jgi:hypothetical protein